MSAALAVTQLRNDVRSNHRIDSGDQAGDGHGFAETVLGLHGYPHRQATEDRRPMCFTSENARDPRSVSRPSFASSVSLKNCKAGSSRARMRNDSRYSTRSEERRVGKE